ncbi:MAG: hypothetical protein WCZ10_15025, partial [Desulfobulbaceae bacterium]
QPSQGQTFDQAKARAVEQAKQTGKRWAVMKLAEGDHLAVSLEDRTGIQGRIVGYGTPDGEYLVREAKQITTPTVQESRAIQTTEADGRLLEMLNLGEGLTKKEKLVIKSFVNGQAAKSKWLETDGQVLRVKGGMKIAKRSKKGVERADNLPEDNKTISSIFRYIDQVGIDEGQAAGAGRTLVEGAEGRKQMGSLEEAEQFLRDNYKGHGTVYGSCGHVLRNCRCSRRDEHQVIQVPEKCRECGGPKDTVFEKDSSRFFQQYNRWNREQEREFRASHPQHRKDRIEITDDGDVFVHTGGGYPAIYRKQVEPWKASRHYTEGLDDVSDERWAEIKRRLGTFNLPAGMKAGDVIEFLPNGDGTWSAETEQGRELVRLMGYPDKLSRQQADKAGLDIDLGFDIGWVIRENLQEWQDQAWAVEDPRGGWQLYTYADGRKIVLKRGPGLSFLRTWANRNGYQMKIARDTSLPGKFQHAGPSAPVWGTTESFAKGLMPVFRTRAEVYEWHRKQADAAGVTWTSKMYKENDRNQFAFYDAVNQVWDWYEQDGRSLGFLGTSDEPLEENHGWQADYELETGIQIELENCGSRDEAAAVAQGNLKNDPEYYTKLQAAMEEVGQLPHRVEGSTHGWFDRLARGPGSADIVANFHRVKIAKRTLRLSDVEAKIMGGMTKDEARAVLRKAGWSDAKIKAWEDGYPLSSPSKQYWESKPVIRNVVEVLKPENDAQRRAVLTIPAMRFPGNRVEGLGQWAVSLDDARQAAKVAESLRSLGLLVREHRAALLQVEKIADEQDVLRWIDPDYLAMIDGLAEGVLYTDGDAEKYLDIEYLTRLKESETKDPREILTDLGWKLHPDSDVPLPERHLVVKARRKKDDVYQYVAGSGLTSNPKLARKFSTLPAAKQVAKEWGDAYPLTVNEALAEQDIEQRMDRLINQEVPSSPFVRE